MSALVLHFEPFFINQIESVFESVDNKQNYKVITVGNKTSEGYGLVAFASRSAYIQNVPKSYGQTLRA